MSVPDEPPLKKLKPDDGVSFNLHNVDNSETNPKTCTNQNLNDQSIELPPELASMDWTQRVAWGKYHPYAAPPLPLTAVDTEPTFSVTSPALCHHVHALSGRARACTVHLTPQPGQSRPRPVPTPMFMPVGTKGCLKALLFQELTQDPALQCPIILANTYHLAIQPGTELIDQMDGLHAFQGLPNLTRSESSETVLPYNILTDSGGFQMVSLVKLSEVTEEGVAFENPYHQQQHDKSKGRSSLSTNSTNINETDNQESEESAQRDLLLLRPEDSIRHQNNIGANIIMALDDVISSVTVQAERFVTATHRTLRWYDRCYAAHAKKETQNLFPIVQGGLDTELGGLREQCLAGFRYRELELQYITPGYSIGGLAGGEEKDMFWKVVDQCCKALPDNKPRYLMGYVCVGSLLLLFFSCDWC